MKHPFVALTALLTFANGSANAADLPQPPVLPTGSAMPTGSLCRTAPSFSVSARAPTGRISVTSTSMRSELRTSSRMACCRLREAPRGRPIFTWRTGSRSRRRSRADTSNVSAPAIGYGEQNSRTIIWEQLRPMTTRLSRNSARTPRSRTRRPCHLAARLTCAPLRQVFCRRSILSRSLVTLSVRATFTPEAVRRFRKPGPG